MEITKFQHACLAVKTSSASFVIDPGVYTNDLIIPRHVDAIVITHEHPDHCNEALVKRIAKKHPKAVIIGHSQVVSKFGNLNTTTVQSGEVINISGSKLEFFGGEHAPILSTLKTPANLCLMIDDKFYYAGDSFTTPNAPVDILALPVSAPWLKISESIDFLHKINPQLAFPTHDAILSREGKDLVDRIILGSLPQGTSYSRIDGNRLTASSPN